MIQQETATLIVSGLGIGGTLGGIVIGHLLSQSSERKQWVLDRRHEEFKELIKALDVSMLAEATGSDDSMELTPQERRDKARRTSEFLQIIRTCIFTAADIRRLDLDREWRGAVGLYRTNNDSEMFDSSYKILMRNSLKLPPLRNSRSPNDVPHPWVFKKVLNANFPVVLSAYGCAS